MTRPSVVIVGGGVLGASAAYHLAARGWDVLVVDRGGGPGEGSTGRATGGFRAQFASPTNVRLSLLARAKLRRFADEIGADPGYQPCGYLWLAATAAERALLEAAHAVQRAEGLAEARLVDADEALRLNPALAPGGIAGGAFCPSDGFIRPRAILDGYLAAARRLGARVEWGREVVGFLRDEAGRLAGVVTPAGPISAGAVVLAAGAWARPVAALAGVELPVEPLRRQVAPTVPTDVLPASMPMTIFLGDGFHLRVRDGRVLLLRPTPGVPGRPFDTPVEPGWLDEVHAVAAARVPPLAGVPLDRAAAWAGLYEVSPDHLAILGAAPGCDNLFIVGGASGHGVMHSPALGQLLAELMSGAPTAIDVSPLAPERFSRGGGPPAELL